MTLNAIIIVRERMSVSSIVAESEVEELCQGGEHPVGKAMAESPIGSTNAMLKKGELLDRAVALRLF